MESDQSKDTKVVASSSEVMSGTGVVEQFQVAPNTNNWGQGGLVRQPSMTKTNCLCSPTTHAGSFRCRLHRAPNGLLQRTKSMELESLRDHQAHGSMVDDATGDAKKYRMH